MPQSNVLNTGPKRQLTKERAKQCLICGDKAYVFNFGVITCQSCKAFFRRNALKNKNFICAFDNNCNIDVITRRFCQKCRLDKCFNVGMKKDWILNEDELTKMRTKILENKIKKRNKDLYKRLMVSKTEDITDDEDEGCHTSSDCSAISESTSDSYDSGKCKSISSGDSSAGDVTTDMVTVKSDENVVMSNVLDKTYDITCLDIYKKNSHQKSREFHESVIAITKHVQTLHLNLNENECNKLLQLFYAINYIREPNLSELQPVITNSLNFKAAMAVKLDKEIRNFITVAQKVPEFDSLCENDRIALVKYGSVEVLCMRMIQFYNNEDQCWTIMIDKNNWILSKIDQFKNAGVKAVFRSCFSKIADEWDSDSIILDLLTVIVLFDPNRPNIIHREVIKLHQNIYMYLLQRYLLMKYRSEYKSKIKFLNLMNTLSEINILGEIFMKRCFVRKANLGPFLKEILDIHT
ncbi:nuclear hormone receptor HR96-like [Oppia nitens]|uniref:nuclear hormone receptor HR96-like n=1 Tax=Oppia nitens TaxID=1686743 RepID=UPI0023DA0C36|nr:nuclear hormone receptor HR96-like [Oppia nitens]